MRKLARTIRGFAALGCVVWLSANDTLHAEVKPHALFTDGVVLQRQSNVNVWGAAEPGERVTVGFRGHETATQTDTNGRWLVQVATHEAGGPFSLSIAGTNTIRLDNVLVGEVWIGSGQSNMGWPLASRPGSKELLGTENTSIRLFNVPNRRSDGPATDVDGQWSVCGPASLVNFSAVAYYFGCDLQTSLQVPIGLIHASYGGSGIEAWTRAETTALSAPKSDTTTPDTIEDRRRQERVQQAIAQYEAAVAKAKQDGTPPPVPPRGLQPTKSSNGQLYNGMIAPLIPFNIRGVIWYQGEANVGRAADYERQFETLIRDWRHAWNQGNFPFLFVQIAPFEKIVEQPRESQWAQLREAQLRTSQKVSDTGMAVITDWGHETEIHVRQKRPVGERLALLARGLVYGEKVIWSGPQYADVRIEGQQMIVRFSQVASGLIARRMIYEDVRTDGQRGMGGALHVAADDASNVPLTGFTIAGADRKFVNATAVIQGENVVVSSPEITEPHAVRYGWANYPTGNLFNRDGLPASPFRTDDWPLSTAP